jgi:hypothetical protein
MFGRYDTLGSRVSYFDSAFSYAASVQDYKNGSRCSSIFIGVMRKVIIAQLKRVQNRPNAITIITIYCSPPCEFGGMTPPFIKDHNSVRRFTINVVVTDACHSQILKKR